MGRAFRTDIEGLRAVAILPILLFHLKPTLCPGGFAGVDIFFVISGYLITKMITDEGQGFRFATFYSRRLLRLFPALLVAVIATLIAAWSILSPHQYIGLAKSSLATLFAASNFYFFATTGYFAGEAIEHPLLHTWSLGVEEQFYFVWPLLLLAIHKFRWALLPTVSAIAALSFAATLACRNFEPDFVFYMMPFRVFEFALGACLVALRPFVDGLNDTARNILGAVGAALMAITFTRFDGHMLWPSVLTLVPVFATVLFIVAGAGGIWHRILSMSPLRFFGKTSYSLYLAHWPVITLIQAKEVVDLTPRDIALAAGISIVLGTLLHFAVEAPFRLEPSVTGRPMPRAGHLLRFRLVAAALGLAGAVAVSAAVIATDGFPRRISITQHTNEALTYAGDLCDAKKARCAFGDSNSADIVYLVGDSHALNLVYGLDLLFKANGLKGIALFDHGCLFVAGTTRFIRGTKDLRCATNIAETFEHVSQNTRPVIYAGAYGNYVNDIGLADASGPLQQTTEEYYDWLRDQLGTSLDLLRPDLRPIVLMKQTYDTGIDLAKCSTQPGANWDLCKPATRAAALWAARQADTMIDSLNRRFASVKVFDPKLVFCPTEDCTVRDGEKLYFRDKVHLTNSGSEFLVGGISKDLLAILKPPPS